MSLETLILSSLVRPTHPRRALVLMGGGARTAYQVGALGAIGEMLAVSNTAERFPFDILVGTSAGALNATFLASRAAHGLAAFAELSAFWQALRSSQVYRFRVPSWVRASRLVCALVLARQVRAAQAFLDNLPLADTLHKAISLDGIEQALASKHLRALAVTASSYTSGVHWTFCQTARGAGLSPWSRPGRRADFSPITIEHLMASSALPFIFPSTPIWVDGHKEFFGDGSMRQSSPLSPALHLGANKVLVIGSGQPERAAIGTPNDKGSRPTLGMVAGHAMASVFQDTLQADVEQAQRVTKTLTQLPREVAAVLPYLPIDVLALTPSQSLDDLAHTYAGELPMATYNALAGLGALGSKAHPSGAAMASYLLFEPGFVGALMRLGAQDARARQAELLAFFSS